MVNEATATLEWMLGLHVDLSDFYDLAVRDGNLNELTGRFQGMKPPCFPTLFEGIANAVTGQQLSLSFAIQLLNRLVRAFGARLSPDEDSPRAFPRPEDIAGLDPEAFRSLGFNRRKGETLIELARMLLGGRLDMEILEKLDDSSAVNLLCSLRGIGRWSAEYLLLRTLGRTNVFPADDVAGQKNLQRWLQLPDPPDYSGVRRLLDRWQPFSGLIYFYLLLERLSTAGHLS
jgi:DNA-3-methyladenine glycosylase II